MSTINGLQFLFNSFLRFSVVIQKDALVSLAKFLYFCEWKKVISPDFEVDKTNFKGLGQPLRVALTGSKFGPGLYDIVISLGKDDVEKRLGKIL